MTPANLADAFGIRHLPDCGHPERVARDGDGWRCNSCGQASPRAGVHSATGR